MLTKFFLHYDDTEYELKDDDLYNWDQIMCSYKRGDYDGVVRSFTSQFVFVNKARKILLSIYLRDRYDAQVSISVMTITNRWEWERKFICPLDFSTINWEKYTLTINAVDNSLSSIIKANKGTKYEFVIGEDIIPDSIFRYDRMPMQESVTYEFTQGTQNETTGALSVTFERGQLPFVGSVEKEIVINGSIYYKDDQDVEPGSYMLRAKKDVDVDLDYSIAWRQDTVYGEGLTLAIRIKRDGELLEAGNDSGGTFVIINKNNYSSEGTFGGPSYLPDASSVEDPENAYAIINRQVWVLHYNGNYYWENTGQTEEEFFTRIESGNVHLSLKEGDLVIMTHTLRGDYDSFGRATFKSSKFIFKWFAEGSKVEIDAIRPKTVAKALLDKIADGLDVNVNISEYDERLARTYLMAAESARGIEEAKFYSSFTEFCEWLSAVFGYVYYLDEDENLSINFVHRSEIFGSDNTRVIPDCRGIKYTVDNSSIYSSVTVGYDKKDYNSINGRDEFNFNTTYTTGCTVNDRELSLISKYRADCYGIEFAVQKRGEKTTDDKGDQDVFFILCASAGELVLVDRTTVTIENSISDKVFNGAFSPMECVRANAGLIGLQSEEVCLKFASSTGNSEIVIDGEPMSADIVLNTPMATPGVIEFTTNEVDDPLNVNDLVEVRDEEGTLYRGYLKEADIKYTKTEAAKYKLIVKEIEL